MIAVISDVHANIAALKNVIHEIRRRGIGRIYCLGDCVGYSSSREETIALLRKEDLVSIKRDHDMMAVGEKKGGKAVNRSYLELNSGSIPTRHAPRIPKFLL